MVPNVDEDAPTEELDSPTHASYSLVIRQESCHTPVLL